MTDIQDDPSASNRIKVLFILGAARSGTSSLIAYVRDNLPVQGDSEGHIFPLFGRIDNLVRESFIGIPDEMAGTDTNTLTRIGRTRILEILWDGFSQLVRPAEDRWWVDKTPHEDALRYLHLIPQHLFDIRCVYIHRNGLDTVASRMRKFPYVTFEDHCRQWAQNILLWHKAKNAMPDLRCVETTLERLTAEPAAVLGMIADLIEVPLPDDIKPLRQIERTRMGETARSSFTQESLETFRRICRPALDLTGQMATMPDIDDLLPEGEPVRLPPPVGQRGVHIQVANERFCYGEVDEQGLRIFLHPGNSGDVPSLIHYHAVPRLGRTKFQACVSVEHDQCKPIQFSVAYTSEDGTWIESHLTCPPGESRQWAVELDDCAAMPDIILATSMPHQEPNTNAWAFITDPRIV